MDSENLAWHILEATVPLSSRHGVTYKDLSDALQRASQIVLELQEKKQVLYKTTVH